MSSYLALVIGAILGSSFRYFFTLLNFTILGLPAATILVNIIGSAMAGYFLNKFNGALYIFVYIGFFGSFTTLSCLLYTSPSPRDVEESRMPSSA